MRKYINEIQAERICQYCGKTFFADDISYHINPFCSECIANRLKTASPKNKAVEFAYNVVPGYSTFIVKEK